MTRRFELNPDALRRDEALDVTPLLLRDSQTPYGRRTRHEGRYGMGDSVSDLELVSAFDTSPRRGRQRDGSGPDGSGGDDHRRDGSRRDDEGNPWFGRWLGLSRGLSQGLGRFYAFMADPNFGGNPFSLADIASILSRASGGPSAPAASDRRDAFASANGDDSTRVSDPYSESYVLNDAYADRYGLYDRGWRTDQFDPYHQFRGPYRSMHYPVAHFGEPDDLPVAGGCDGSAGCGGGNRLGGLLGRGGLFGGGLFGGYSPFGYGSFARGLLPYALLSGAFGGGGRFGRLLSYLPYAMGGIGLLRSFGGGIFRH